MDKLIAVEYCPVTVKAGKNTNKPSRLDGMVGEVLESRYNSVSDPLSRSTNKRIFIQFPLTIPGHRLGLLPGHLEQSPETLCQAGIEVENSDLFILKQTPVSYYKRRLITEGTDVATLAAALLGSDFYYYTRSKTRFHETLASLNNAFALGWYWKMESDPANKSELKKRRVFVEARLYGIDTIINTYDKSKIDGAVIEVITRNLDYPTMDSDTYIVSSQSEYISYVDGVDIPQNAIVIPWQDTLKKYYNTISIDAKTFLKQRKVDK